MIQCYFSPMASLAELKALVASARADSRPRGLVILGSIDNDHHADDLDAFLKQLPLPVGGGLFPALLFDGQVQHSGWIVYAIANEVSVACIDHVSCTAGYGRQLSAADTHMILVNGHASNISSLLQHLYADSHVSTKFFGGGVGSLSSPEKRCLLSNQGLMRDMAVVISIHAACGIGVSHGWKPASPIFRVTAADGNAVHELDYRPALEVYTELVRQEFAGNIDPDNMIATASMYPLGIRRLDGSLVVRDPIATTASGSLICVGEFDSDCFVYLLTSDMQTLLESSRDANRQASTDLKLPVGQRIVFDCISRSLLMDDRFAEELAVLRQDGTPMSGALSIGEIAGNSRGFLEFYNKTTAVAAFPGV